MGQQQFRVSFSVGTKLLLCILLLLFTAIGFLNVSTVVLLTGDKRASTSRAQSTEAVLLGKEFVNAVGRAMDILRLALGRSAQAQSEALTATLQTILGGQSRLEAIRIARLRMGATSLETLGEAFRRGEGHRLSASGFDLSVETIRPRLPELLLTGSLLMNLSTDETPMLVVAVVEHGPSTKSDPSDRDLRLALGFLTLEELNQELSSPFATVANRGGEVLYDVHPAGSEAGRSLASDPLFEAAWKGTKALGTQDYKLDQVHFLGSYYKPGMELVVLARTEWTKAMAETQALVEKFVLLGCVTVGFAILFTVFFARTITAPIDRLYQATVQVASGNFDVNLRPTGTDEISALTRSFLAMSSRISDLVRESMQKVQLEHELAIASTVQQNLIPPECYRSPKALIHSRYRSAAACGGDWWGFFEVRGKLCLTIADATGHGLSSALITAAARSCFSVVQKLATEDPAFDLTPRALLALANRAIYESGSGRIMMTFFACVVDVDTRQITFASAGHNPGWLFRKQGGFQSLVATGTRLGEKPELERVEEARTGFESGDLLFLYTDGVIEGMNAAGAAFGKMRLLHTVEAGLKAGPETVVTEVLDQFLAHNGEKPLDDDITLVAIELMPLESGPKLG